ncbi:MAG: glycosyltransferase [Anaerolineae bacterium]
MPKALFFNVPGHGHVNPSLPLVAELVRRGHEITYLISEGFRAQIESAGAIFHPYRTVNDDYFDVRGLSGAVPGKVAYELISTAADILPELLNSARALQPDYVMYDGMCPWGYMVARVLGLPAIASLALLPLNTPPLTELLNPDIFRAFLMIFRDIGNGFKANGIARELGKQYQVPALGLQTMLNSPADLAISYTSAEFQPNINTVAKNVRFVGRILDDMPGDPNFSFEQVKGRKLVYVSLGTLNNEDVSFFKTCIEAFTGTDYYVMMTTGKRISPESFGPLPENIAIFSWVPQFDILKQAALFITHGGLNSIHDGLYFGVPLLLVPQQGEQLVNALRVVELGAGLKLRKDQISADVIRRHARQLLTDDRFSTHAASTGATFRAAGGAARGADEIERFLSEQRQ